ncbi:divergent polysaccharide deacetylase family protein [Magnetospirillum molischianum]|uniref:Divergent polysaccharide deacetylase family protein n=1 Tax=Magnetospirillum molischianum DSM 120 TaxID=1150626 RepID=H8FRL4_MAGML|nr:divergent polysaccharide deacetylase family protein [Magnetospirillum molischianum]CCG41002.1 conserved exported hypothetical protein [Magnetospirillum molischianum DSM 120]
MGRREVRRMLMGYKRPLWERPGVIATALVVVLALGLLLGIGVGRWSAPQPHLTPPAAVETVEAVQPAQPETVAEAPTPPSVSSEPEGPAVEPGPALIQPPPPRAEPGSSESLEIGSASDVVAMLPAPPPPPSPQPLTQLPPAGEAIWKRHAVPSPRIAGRPMIAVIIDDLGVDRRRAERVTTLPGPLTLSFMTYAEDLTRLTTEARRHGHELMVHVPMQPRGAHLDSGREVLEVGQTPGEIRRRLDWGLSRFDGFIGINNHMGSRFTADPGSMRVVMAELRRRGLVFVDSVTTEHSAGPEVAREFGVPFTSRHVFLDNDQGVAHVRAQLAKAESYARRHGFAVAIGHPHDGTIEALAGWIPGLEAKGMVLVPISTVIRAGAGG